MSTKPCVLVVDDNEDVLQSCEILLSRRGFTPRTARTASDAWVALSSAPVEAVVLDLNLTPRGTSGEDGLRLLREIMRRDPSSIVIVVTGHSGVAVAVEAMRSGAHDFVMKPWSNDRLVRCLEDGIQHRRSAVEGSPREGRQPDHEPLLGASAAIGLIKDTIAKVAMTSAAVFISGESGVGKSLVAAHLHCGRPEAGRLGLIDLGDLGAGEEGVLEAHLRTIRQEPPDTLVLEGVDALSRRDQGCLLRHLQALSDLPRPPRLVSTSRRSRDLLEQHDEMRSDLLYELSTMELHIPPLRDRREDVRVLADYFVPLFALRHAKPVRAISQDGADRLASAPWPNNVRALRQCLERSVLLADRGTLDASNLVGIEAALDGVSDPAPLTLAQSEKAMVEDTLKRHRFNVSRAADELGLTRAALYRRMARHGL